MRIKDKYNYLPISSDFVIIGLLFLILISLDSCSGCSKSGLNSLRSENYASPEVKSTLPHSGSNESIIKMRFSNGVYLVPVEINGIMMDFIFDTGASDITISAAEAIFLYRQGKLSDEDIKGTREYQIADGTIAEGTVINIKKVKIGNRTIENVEASIMHNLDAPLLMGQSALSRFGRITVDYNRNEIRFD